MQHWWRRFINWQTAFIVSIFVLVLYIFLETYIPGKWLSGWDNLHPEFNFHLNVARSLSSVWQEYQGLGLLGGMAHASELPRQLFLWLFSSILPPHILRYFWTFFMLFVGPVGMFTLVKALIKNDQTQRATYLISSFAGFFYLANLVVIQMFYEPYDPYVTMYGFLPWILWSMDEALKRGQKKYFFFFFSLFFAGSGLAYVTSTFVALLLVISVWLLIFVVTQRFHWRAILKSLVVGLLVFLANAYWFLPFGYFVATNVQAATLSKVNIFSTYDTFLQNKEYGDWSKIFTMQGYWLEFTDVNDKGMPVALMSRLDTYLRQPLVSLSLSVYAYLLIICIGIAAVLSFANKHKRREVVTAVSIFIVAWFFVSLGKPPFTTLYELAQKIPFVTDIFRTAYTKWSFLLLLSQILIISLAFSQLFFWFKERKVLRSLTKGGLLFTWVLVIIISGSIWQGSLVDKKTITSLSPEYFEVIKFFAQQDSHTRIANFPQTTIFGWDIIPGVYRGSGFLWYGIQQPILDRAFDPWSRENEAYYTQLQAALYGENLRDFEQVLHKYSIDWLLVDKNYGESTVFAFDTLEKFAHESELIGTPVTFGKITIYPVKNTTKQFIRIPSQLIELSSVPTFAYTDPIKGIDVVTQDQSTYFPWWNMTEQSNMHVEMDESKLTLSQPLTASTDINQLDNATLTDWLYQPDIPAEIYVRDNHNKTVTVRVHYLMPTISVGNQKNQLVIDDSFYTFSVKAIPSYLQINQMVFAVPTLTTEKEQVVGKVLISTGEQNIIKLFADQSFSDELTGGLTQQPLNNCWQERTGTYWQDESTANSAKFTARRALVCKQVPLTFFHENNAKEALVKLSFNVMSPTFNYPRARIIDIHHAVDYSTIGDTSLVYSEESRNTWQKKDVLLPIRGIAQDSQLVLELSLDAFEKDEAQTIEYQNVVATYFPVVGERQFTSPLFTQAKIISQKDQKLEQTIKVTVPRFPYWQVAGKRLNSLATPPNTSDCMNVNPEFEVVKSVDQNSVNYQTTKGHNCDYLPMENLWTNQGLLLSITHQSQVGRGLELCVIDPSRSICAFKTKLAQQTLEPVMQSFVLAPSHGGRRGYKVFYNLQGIGDQLSQLELSNITVEWLPYNWLQQISLGQLDLQSNNLNVATIQPKETFWYTVKLQSNGGGTIALMQGYAPGWIAFDPVQPRKLFEHSRFNGWANSWKIPANTKEVVVVFWPQILGYVGYGFLLLGASGFGYWGLRRRNIRPKQAIYSQTIKDHLTGNFPHGL